MTIALRNYGSTKNPPGNALMLTYGRNSVYFLNLIFCYARGFLNLLPKNHLMCQDQSPGEYYFRKQDILIILSENLLHPYQETIRYKCMLNLIYPLEQPDLQIKALKASRFSFRSNYQFIICWPG